MILERRGALGGGEPCTNAGGRTWRAYLAGNLCRCGSYLRILAAVQDAAARFSAAHADRSAVGIARPMPTPGR